MFRNNFFAILTSILRGKVKMSEDTSDDITVAKNNENGDVDTEKENSVDIDKMVREVLDEEPEKEPFNLRTFIQVKRFCMNLFIKAPVCQ